eukprot:scaffold1322_cov372-Pavlova_lutheri.AAC.10
MGCHGGRRGCPRRVLCGGDPTTPRGGGVHREEEERHEPRLGREATMACPLEVSRWPEPTQAKNGRRRQRTIHRNTNRMTSASGCTGDGLSLWNGARRHEGARPPRPATQKGNSLPLEEEKETSAKTIKAQAVANYQRSSRI